MSWEDGQGKIALIQELRVAKEERSGLAKSEAGWRITKEKLLSAMDASYRGSDGDFVPVADLGRNRAGANVMDAMNAGFQIAPGGCANGRCGQ